MNDENNRNMVKPNFLFPFSIISLLIIGFMSNDLFLPSMPEMRMHFSVSDNVMQTAIGFWFLGSMSLQLILGPLSDRYGRKSIILLSTVLLAVASLLCVLVKDINAFMFFRFLQGVAVSGIMVTAFASLHEAYEPLGRATAMMGYAGMCSAIAPIAGPIVGGFVAKFYGWSTTFYIVLAVCVLLVPFVLLFMPNAAKHQSVKWRMIGCQYKTLISNRAFLTGILSYSLLFFSGGAFLSAAPFVYTGVYHIPLQYIGLGMAPMFVCYMIAASLAGKLEKHFEANSIIRLTLIYCSFMIALFCFLSVTAYMVLAMLIFFVAVYYVALGLSGPPLSHLVLSQASAQYKGIASSLLTFTMMLGSMLGSFLISLIYDGSVFVLAITIAAPIFLATVIFYIYSKTKLIENQENAH